MAEEMAADALDPVEEIAELTTGLETEDDVAIPEEAATPSEIPDDWADEALEATLEKALAARAEEVASDVLDAVTDPIEGANAAAINEEEAEEGLEPTEDATGADTASEEADPEDEATPA